MRFASVGLQPSNPPEHTAFARMIEEMLDRIVELGFLTFSDLRDTISRNQLKLPDLSDPPEFVRGDPLLRLDRRLATTLDGVYRPGEIYLRWLERLTAPAFGTADRPLADAVCAAAVRRRRRDGARHGGAYRAFPPWKVSIGSGFRLGAP